MKLTDFRYLLAYTIPCSVYISLLGTGFWSFTALAYAFGFLPFLELFSDGSPQNLSTEEEEVTKHHPIFDYFLWALVPLEYVAVYIYVDTLAHNPTLTTLEWVGKTIALALGAGIVGINVAHELGHRNNRFEQGLSKALLLTSLYMHFFIEHNRGHHKYVATPLDPATSRYGEPIYAFWVRSIYDSFVSAWRIEAQSLQKKGLPIFSLQNEMIRFIFTQSAFVAAIGWMWGAFAMGSFLITAMGGILLLETVNYIEHYGLVRKEIQQGVYERVLPRHSWNSNHAAGRIMLFELTRHSDHHYLASRKYQILRHFEESPQLPTGYPGMMLLSLIPPLWFSVMNPRVQEWQKSGMEG